jgi:hypothetical protein
MHTTGQGMQLPPQSTPVSLPFMMPSKQLGAAQAFPTQFPDRQSAATAHISPFPQAGHPPPQSTSVSVPSFTLSVQVAWQTPSGPPGMAKHLREAQSES